MASKTTDWRPGPTVCRCCLTEGCYKDISTEYFWMGKREVYAEMLSETFSLSIAYSQSGGPNSNSRLICEPCISRLRDASDFRRQVQECEKTFTQYLDPATTVVELDAPLVTADAQVKVERVKIKKEASDDDFDDRPDFNDADDDDDDDLDDQPLTKLASKVPKKESVDLMDLLDNAKAGEKRKSTTKTKTPAAKKAKGKKEAKATTSKAPKPEKKKKDQVQDTSAEEVVVEEGTDFISQLISFQSDGKFEDDIKKLPNIVYQPAEHFVTIKDKAKMIYQALKKLEEASKKVASKTKSNDSLNKKSAEKNIRRVPVKTFNVVIREYPVRNMSSKKEAELQKAKRKADGRYKNEKKNALLILRHSSALPLRISPTDAIGCRFCTEEFNDPSLFRSHMSSKHSTVDKSTVLTHKNDLKRVDIQDLHCLLCSRDFEALKPLAEHLITEHELEINLQLGLGLVPLKLSKDSYICLVCDKKCLSYSHLGKHAGEHWLGHICDICGKGYQTRVGLDWHRREHTSMKHACQRCKMSFPNAQAKRDHISANKNCFPNKCRICKERLRYSEQLQKHLIEVHNMPEKMYRCEYCNIDFKSRLEQKYHFKRLHTDDTLCKYCEKRFCSPRSLRDHVNAVHTGERTVQCLVCNNFFVSRKALRWHATIHKPKTPCPVCGRLFARRHVLRTHVQKSHPEANVKI